jgi:cobalamin biosynthesis protein CobT
LIGIDISGSTVGVNIALAKRAAMTQAELCHRVGVDFAIYAHTANGAGGPFNWSDNLYLDMYEIKAFNTPWDSKSKDALIKIGPDAENLDGRGVEFYRRIIQKHPATDKIILYYSDGKMPAANYHEELEILQDQIRHCKRDNITLLGVGIRTDSPKRHGLDTVQVDREEDLVKVVRHLGKRLR